MAYVHIQIETNAISVGFNDGSVFVVASTLTATDRAQLIAIIAKVRAAAKVERLAAMDAARARATAEV